MVRATVVAVMMPVTLRNIYLSRKRTLAYDTFVATYENVLRNSMVNDSATTIMLELKVKVDVTYVPIFTEEVQVQ